MSAPWYRSKLFLIAATVAVLLVAALLIAPYLLDLDRYRPLIVSQLEQATGRKVEIENLRLHFLPSIRVVVTNLRVKNPRDFPEGDTVAVSRVDIGVALGALLRREIEVTSVMVSGVELNLLANEGGQNNYSSLLEPKRSTPEKKPGAAPVSLARIGSVSVSDVRVNSGAFWRRDRRIHPSWSLTGANLRAGGFDLSDPAWMSKTEATVDLSSIEVSSPALKEPLRFTSGTVRAKNNAAEGDYALALGPLRGNGTVKVANLARFSAAEFTLHVKEANLAELGALASG
ncbi:MAG: AsmA family protein, partial [Candidatus Acidiferrales bacterium]